MIACRVVSFLLLLMLSVFASAETALPPGAVQYMPTLKAEIDKNWPDMPIRSVLAATVEQESCISLKHKKCWNPRAELKTDREYGFGFTQLTVTKRFNMFDEVKKMDPSLKDWSWEDRYNPNYQLRAFVVMERNLFRSVMKWTPTTVDRLSFMDSAYNGGVGGVMKDRIMCKNTKGCDPTKWFGNVELTSAKSKIAVKCYGKSFYDINREHVRNDINLLPRRQKYVPYMDS